MEIEVQKEHQAYAPLGPSGLGGWLVLVQIGLIATLFTVSFQLLSNNIPSFSAEYWDILASKEGQLYHRLWAPLIIFEAAANMLLLLMSVVTLVLFYRKKAIFPRVMILLYIFNLFISVTDYIFILNIPLARETGEGSGLRSIVRAVFTSLIWVAYFRKSDRVKNTFVR